jgi:hypothetical protein
MNASTTLKTRHSYLKTCHPRLKACHPRAGGDPCLLSKLDSSHTMDSRLRGNDKIKGATV